MSEPLDKSPDHALANSAHHDEKKYLDEVIDKKLVNHDVSLDEVIPGSEGVTHRELATLRLVTDSLPFSAWLVTIAEFAERWTYYGTTNLYSNYIRAPLPPGSNNGAVLPENRLVGVAGALGKGQQTSFNIRTFNTFWVYCTPLLGGVLADTLLGRFNTILIFSIVCFLGHIILVATSTPAALANTNGAMAGLVVSILVMGLGAGCIKANVSPLIGEQYQGKLRKKTLESGEVVIVSPQITIQSVYMYFYAAINFGACGAISAAFLARDNGYWIAFLVPTCIFALVPVVLIAFKKNYVVTPPRGSVLLETFRVFKLAAGAHWSWNPVAAWKNFHADDFWDVAKPTKFATGEVPTKITWDDEFVGEVARTFNACKVFLWFPIFWLCYSQIDGNLSTVAAGMRLDGTPNDLILNLNPISIIVMIPIFDYGIYPFLRKKGINFTPIKRICAGFIVAGLAMLYAGVLQHFIYKQSPCHDNEPSACTREDGNPDPANINVWVVSGPYILVGMAEIFASITSLEYAFTKAPKRMKSVVVAFSQFQTAFASALNFALTELNVEQRFGYLFGSFGIAAWVAGFIFFLTFRDYDKQEAELNQIGLGEREGFVDERSDLPHVESGSIKSSTK